MDHGHPVWSSAPLIVLVMVVALLAAGCDCAVSPAPASLPTDEVLLVDARTLQVLLEPMGQTLVVRSTSGAVQCEVGPRVAEGWQAIQKSTASGRTYRRTQLGLDPNLAFGMVVVGLGRELETGGYEIKHAEGEQAVRDAVGGVNTILSACGLEERLELTLITVRGEPG